MTLQQLLNQIDGLKTKLDNARALSASELSQLREYYKNGNGRTARLAMNLALLQNGYPVTIIPPLRRVDYLLALQREQARRVKEDRSDSFEFFIAECVLDSLADYTRMLNLTVPRA